jgi:phenylacetate-CoA ligase
MSLKRGFIKLIKDFLLRTKYYNAFNLNESDIRSLLQEQVGKKKFHLAGYASSLYVIADTYLRLGMTDVKFDKAISLASKMFPHYRKRIKEAFGCDVIDTYGLSEGLFIGAQKDIEYYYILSPHVFIEILDEQGNEVKDGELGYVVATSLDAYAMPFIRYYTGDMAVKLPKSRYPANREMNFPLLEKIIGRDTDFVRTRSGKILVVEYFSAICEFFPEIYQFKVIQRNLDEIEIEYIPDEKFSEETLKSIGHQIHDYLKEDFPIIWRKVDVILPTPSGKPQIIQSFLKNEQLKN